MGRKKTGSYKTWTLDSALDYGLDWTGMWTGFLNPQNLFQQSVQSSMQLQSLPHHILLANIVYFFASTSVHN